MTIILLFPAPFHKNGFAVPVNGFQNLGLVNRPQARRRRFSSKVIVGNNPEISYLRSSKEDFEKDFKDDSPIQIKLDPSRPFRNFAEDVKNPFFENPFYKEIQIIYALLAAAAMYQNFSDKADSRLLESFQFPVLLIGFHLLCVMFSVELTTYKGYERDHIESRTSVLRALCSGPLEVYRVSKIDDCYVKEARTPLTLELSTVNSDNIDNVERRRRMRLYGTSYVDKDEEFGNENEKYASSIQQEINITVAKGCELKVRKLIKQLVRESEKEGLKEKILDYAVIQNDIDRMQFKITQTFRDVEQMREYQGSFQYQLWGAWDDLSESKKVSKLLRHSMQTLT